MSRPISALVFLLFAPSALACGGSQEADPGQPIVIEEPAEESTAEPAEGLEESTVEPAEEPELVVSEDACTTDEDCVPGGCCHAATCVGRSNEPQCADAMCTQECRYGTLDCGGACLCHEGRCAARLSVAPQMLPRE